MLTLARWSSDWFFSPWLAAIFKENRITIDNGMISHFLFLTDSWLHSNEQPKLIVTFRLAEGSTSSNKRADDLVIFGPNKFWMQQALRQLHAAVTNLRLTINLGSRFTAVVDSTAEVSLRMQPKDSGDQCWRVSPSRPATGVKGPTLSLWILSNGNFQDKPWKLWAKICRDR